MKRVLIALTYPLIGFNMAKTIRQLNSEKKYTKVKGYLNTPLEIKHYTIEQVLDFKVEDKYQRDLSPKKLTEYGMLDFNLLIPALVSERPKSLDDYSGTYIIDGQHKGIKYVDSDYPGEGFCAMVLKHDENATLVEVEEAEAKAFLAINTKRKQLTQVDKLRADLIVGDETAQRVYDLMSAMDYHCDDFGSTDCTRKEVKSFSQFYYTIDADYAVGTELRLLTAHKFFEAIYGNNDCVQGVAFRGVCFIHRFISEGLTNGRQEHFRNFCLNELNGKFSQKELVKGVNGFDAPRWILHKVIDEYNKHNDRLSIKGKNIGPDSVRRAVETSNEKRFYHPHEWNKSDK